MKTCSNVFESFHSRGILINHLRIVGVCNYRGHFLFSSLSYKCRANSSKNKTTLYRHTEIFFNTRGGLLQLQRTLLMTNNRHRKMFRPETCNSLRSVEQSTILSVKLYVFSFLNIQSRFTFDMRLRIGFVAFFITYFIPEREKTHFGHRRNRKNLSKIISDDLRNK